ncbi:MAG: GNAT family N-acetyltransferase [Acidobacteriota bacterium]
MTSPSGEAPQLEILDLRHFSASQMRPLLRDEAKRWQQRLHWDYTHSTDLLLDYLDSRVLPGFVAVAGSRPIGYAFCVYEASKAVIGDVYAFTEAETTTNPICDRMLRHLIEMLQATPGIERVESQLLMFPAGALAEPFLSKGFRPYPRLFMLCDLRTSPLGEQARTPPRPRTFLLQPWKPDFYEAAAALIHRCYAGHMDSSINDQYRTIHGAQRFLHNIIRFPGCGVFDAENSWVLRDPSTLKLEAMILCSRVQKDVGHITQLCVSPDLRSQGLGSLLLQQCTSELLRRGYHALSLTVTESNTGARNLYERLGFQSLHRFEAMVWDKYASG